MSTTRNNPPNNNTNQTIDDWFDPNENYSSWSAEDLQILAETKLLVSTKTENLDLTHPYRRLGIPITATPEEIKKRYRLLAVKFHPDKNPANTEIFNSIFKAISDAHDVLTASGKSFKPMDVRSQYSASQSNSNNNNNNFQKSDDDFYCTPDKDLSNSKRVYIFEFEGVFTSNPCFFSNVHPDKS